MISRSCATYLFFLDRQLFFFSFLDDPPLVSAYAAFSSSRVGCEIISSYCGSPCAEASSGECFLFDIDQPNWHTRCSGRSTPGSAVAVLARSTELVCVAASCPYSSVAVASSKTSKSRILHRDPPSITVTLNSIDLPILRYYRRTIRLFSVQRRCSFCRSRKPRHPSGEHSWHRVPAHPGKFPAKARPVSNFSEDRRPELLETCSTWSPPAPRAHSRRCPQSPFQDRGKPTG